MENYKKAHTVEQPCQCPFPDLTTDTPEVRVKDGSKIRNLMRFALSRFKEKAVSAEHTGIQEGSTATTGSGEKLCRQIMFTGVGPSVAKAITCVEIMKRRVHGLHQHTKLAYRTVQEVWEPLEPEAGLDSLTVSRNVPCLWVLLSRDSLDRNQPGYQAPGSFDALWAQTIKEEAAGHKHGHRRKREGTGVGRGEGAGRGKGPRKHPGPGRNGEARKTLGHAGGGQN
ncbi:ribonuclease P protein subunit p25-like protein [Myxocyprinus asiaticus]|uniref:ribonuclease P protein subunit p25-like protein n=1 Tax=Myxocyprinus asiaticus TaxID=70543 RepID=UPI002222BFAB|nr:ribonuclease P protein subunit p25-like protein [Myxocyprinus asiaticus]